MVFKNGNIYTVNDARPKAEAVAVKGDRIIFVGSNSEAQKYVGKHTRVIDLGSRTMVPGLTNDQLFFVAFAQGWCMKATPEFERMRATVDSHAHARYRVLGPLANFPEFAQAFGCKEGDPMVLPPEKRARIW